MLLLPYDPEWLELWKKRFDEPLDDAETFNIDQCNYLIEIGNKTNDINEIKGQYMGLLKFVPDFWEKNTNPKDDNIDMTSYLSKLLLNNKIMAVPNKDKWGEIDSQPDLKIYLEDSSLFATNIKGLLLNYSHKWNWTV